jgi:hypothetical protein
MSYVVLVTGGPGEIGIQDRFFQAQKQHDRSRLVRQAFTSPAGHCPTLLTFESTLPDAVFTLGPEEGGALRSARSHVNLENWTLVGYSAGVTGRAISQLNQRKFRVLTTQ